MKKKWKVILYTLLAVLIIGSGAGAYAYWKLQPSQHFQTVPVLNPANPSEAAKPAAPTKHNAFNVLLMGSDQRKGDKLGHTDSMMIAHIDLDKQMYHIISIPRDTRVYLDGYGYTKLTSVQYIVQANKGTEAGVQAAIKAIGDLTGITFNYYAQTNYWGLQAMVDALGGINMNVPFEVKLTHAWNAQNQNKVITTGSHFFDGQMVSEVVHERYSLQSGEYGRQMLQKEAISGIAKAALDPSNVSKLPELVKKVPEFLVATNLSTADMLSVGLAVKNFDPGTQLQYHQVSGEFKTMYDDILKNNNSQLVLNKEELKKLVDQYFKS
ncbi:LCP family glycopolymer transferase [Ectobacillus ponti]|uniref:LCP family protein n=1 Tax=Ectobacillus ponti TaxID=2961894 RepID=A0AA41X622_9BACI|nr:LCP family protein [Ectobacillus ponti]MCP8967848.1 LCP family protein [Ectobacillus ponti]